jgi:hypothetical protein
MLHQIQLVIYKTCWQEKNAKPLHNFAAFLDYQMKRKTQNEHYAIGSYSVWIVYKSLS